MSAILGYARVGTAGQGLEAQLVALTSAGVEPDRIFTDKLSGSAKTARPGLTGMLDYARAGDTLVVTAIDRLGRSVAEVTRTIAELSKRRTLLRALREGIDTATLTGVPLPRSWPPRAASRQSRKVRVLPATKPPKLSAERQDSCAGSPPPANRCASGTWPREKALFAYPVPLDEWPEDPVIVEQVPLRSCRRRGAAIDVIADRSRHNRSQLVFTQARGPRCGVLAVAAHP